MNSISIQFVAACVLSAGAGAAFAHVSLQEPLAGIGSRYQAVLRVGHGCAGSPTNAITVQLPAGFEGAVPQPRPGWKLEAQGAQVRWTAANKESWLAGGQTGEFIALGKLPVAPGPLWFKVLQGCEQGSLDWAQVPARGTSTEGLKAPAALLQVLSAKDLQIARQAPAVQVQGAWVRSTVPGQMGTGGFMTLTAKEATQLVGASTPLAGTTEVHEMKMEGEVMKMRAIPFLALPAGKAVELKPGGHHLMLLDLKQALPKDTSLPLTLLFRNVKGVESRLEVKVPVSVRAPGGGAQTTDGHKH